MNFSFWPTVEKFFQQGAAFLIFLYVARELGPSEIGHISIIYIYIALTIAGLNGSSTYLITKKNLTKNDIKCVLKVNSVITFVIILIYLLSGYCLSVLKSDESYINIFVILCAFPLFFLIYSIPNALLIKEMKFKSLAVRTIIAMVFGAAVVVFSLHYELGYYALLYQQLSFYFLMAFLSIYGFLSADIRLASDTVREEIKYKDILSRMYLTLSNVLYTETPKFVMFFIFPSQIYGLVTVCYRVRHAAAEVLVVGPFSYLLPEVSKSGVSDSLISEVFEKRIKYLLPMITYIGLLAMFAFDFILGEQWDGVGNYIAFSFFCVINYLIYIVFFTIAKVHVFKSTLKMLNSVYVLWTGFWLIIVSSIDFFFTNAFIVIGLIETYFFLSALLLYIFFKKANFFSKLDLKVVYSSIYFLVICAISPLILKLPVGKFLQVLLGNVLVLASIVAYLLWLNRPLLRLNRHSAPN